MEIAQERVRKAMQKGDIEFLFLGLWSELKGRF